MSQALGLQTVAEGVETRGQVDQLRRLGCDSAQGYLYARPAPADAIIKIMSDGTIPTPLVSPH
jgi:EAL domain-containing protein (putative c-di-GMP-specific phosphodiesterase class I)